MKSKIIGLGFALFALIGGSYVFSHAVYYTSDSDVGILSPLTPQVTQASTVKTGPSTSLANDSIASSPALIAPFPARLSIPSLDIDAKVQYAGIRSNGSLGTPSNFSDVAWYKDGTVPGAVGSAVIDGHVDNGLALSGVFKHLGDAKIGDNVYITRNDGEKLHFVVVSVTEYPYEDAPPASIFSAVDGSYLNLITCTGGWVSDDKTYDQRLVVSTKLVS